MTKSFNLVAKSNGGNWHVHSSEHSVQFERLNSPLGTSTYTSGVYHNPTISRNISCIPAIYEVILRKLGVLRWSSYDWTDYRQNEILGLHIERIASIKGLTVLTLTLLED